MQQLRLLSLEPRPLKKKKRKQILLANKGTNGDLAKDRYNFKVKKGTNSTSKPQKLWKSYYHCLQM